MDHQGRFRDAALTAGFPGDEITRFTEHLRLSIRLSAGGDGVPAGQFGGSPRLPAAQEWPSAGGGRLPFVFAVDCAALPGVDGSALPTSGSLLFFLDHENDHLADGEQGYGRVLHVPVGTEGRDLHATLAVELPDWLAERDEDDEDEDDLSPAHRRLLDDLPHRDELRALAYHLWPDDGGLASAYLGGHVDDEVIGSIAEQTLAGREKAGEIVIPVATWYSHVEAEKHRLAGEWMSLARFPVADDSYYSGSFLIRHDDLAAGRLDRALSVTDFSE